jgi:beta-glucosidase/6-phospho-beta-glucosidase/beta-galactosidase
MPLPPRSRLRDLLEPDAFLWATGIEDTFITAPWPATGRTLDEYELTGHYARRDADLALIAECGLRAARYGLPWHRIQPEPRRWDWDWTDRAIDRLLALGIEPILDLVHYGLPPWLDGAYVSAEFPARLGEYAARLADRFRGRVRWWTPLNEPRVTAWYCGKLGWWPPARRGWGGFIAVMRAVCHGIVAASEAIRAADPENVLCHVDATDLYESADPSLQGEVAHRQEIVFLALDLISGRVDAAHPLLEWLQNQGLSDADLAWFHERAVDLDVIGINLYPLFSRKVLSRSARGQRQRMPYAGADIVERLAEMYATRYGRPVIISETASAGPVERRRTWLDDSVAAVRATRARGIPLVGYTWWPLFALVTWGYRQGTLPPERYLVQMGLWDCAGPELERVATPLVDAYRALARSGAEAVGSLAPEALHVR